MGLLGIDDVLGLSSSTKKEFISFCCWVVVKMNHSAKDFFLFFQPITYYRTFWILVDSNFFAIQIRTLQANVQVLCCHSLKQIPKNVITETYTNDRFCFWKNWQTIFQSDFHFAYHKQCMRESVFLHPHWRFIWPLFFKFYLF